MLEGFFPCLHALPFEISYFLVGSVAGSVRRKVFTLRSVITSKKFDFLLELPLDLAFCSEIPLFSSSYRRLSADLEL